MGMTGDPTGGEEGGPVGLVFDVQRCCTHDGPGIRTTVFLKGCPLRCLWCDNPESQRAVPEMMYFEERCTGCGSCLAICPRGALEVRDGKIGIDRRACDGCGECESACSRGALRRVGEYLSVEEVVRRVRRDHPFYRRSGGGVTLSGGEPSLQPGFASEILRRCRELGIHTAVETAGEQEWEALSRLLRFTDLVLYDLKHMDPEEHERLTGVPNGRILENARRMGRRGVPVLVRVPIVPGLTDSEENLRAIVEFCLEMEGLVGVEPLPYHPLGVPKYGRLGREYGLKDLSPPGEEELERIRSRMEGWGVRVFRGYFSRV
jgi:pyruvate formate lyase activating enzyme